MKKKKKSMLYGQNVNVTITSATERETRYL